MKRTAYRGIGFLAGLLLILPTTGMAEMSVGFNLWPIGWGGSIAGLPQYNYFKQGVDWATTTDPWNPTFIAELKEAKTSCLRFMDWGKTNGCNYTTWSQRIKKTVDHNSLKDNCVPTSWGNEAGVAYEWMIDLCNKVNCDLWICVPHKANDDFVTQLATLIKNTLNPDLRVYVEYSNECWNSSFPQSPWLGQQKNLSGIPNPVEYLGRKVYGMGSGGDGVWSEYVYYSCKAVNLFNGVFGENSTRLIRVIAGQAGSGGSGGMNDMCLYHLWCLHSPIVNPLNVKFDAYAIAPYYDGKSESEMRSSLVEVATWLGNFKNSLKADKMPLICYEGGPDNFSSVSIAHLPFQYQLTLDALAVHAAKLDGVFCWYTFVGGCWGLKEQVGDPLSDAPKWKAYIDWLAKNPPAASADAHPVKARTTPKSPGVPASLYDLTGRTVRRIHNADERISSKHEASGKRVVGRHGTAIAVESGY